jgi:hypothetical protein
MWYVQAIPNYILSCYKMAVGCCKVLILCWPNSGGVEREKKKDSLDKLGESLELKMMAVWGSET